MPSEVNFGVREFGENLSGPGEIQLGDPWEQEDNDSQWTGRHDFRLYEGVRHPARTILTGWRLTIPSNAPGSYGR